MAPGVDRKDHVDGVHLGQLPRLTELLVLTRNSLYRIVVIEGADIYVQGGTFCPDFTSAHLSGSRLGRSVLKVGWIGVGLVMEIRTAARHIITSPVQAIIIERSDRPVVVQ